MKPEDLPGASPSMNCDRSEMLRAAAVELRIVSEALRAEARELVATAVDIRNLSEDVVDECVKARVRFAKARTASPQAIHSLSTTRGGKKR